MYLSTLSYIIPKNVIGSTPLFSHLNLKEYRKERRRKGEEKEGRGGEGRRGGIYLLTPSGTNPKSYHKG